MNDLNTVTLSGNLTRDPEFKQINDDFAVCKFGLAVNRSRKTGEEYTEEASFFDVECLGRPYATLADRKLRKGNKINLTGRLEQQRWETPEGEKRSKVVVIVTEINAEAFFKKDDAIEAKTEGDAPVAAAPAATPVEAQVAAAVAADDDIPF
jgi:single-strand DNA-binding protein